MVKKHLTKKQLDDLRTQLIKEEKKMESTIVRLKENDPFNDPDHATDNAAVDTDVREQLGHDTVEAQMKEVQKELILVRGALEKMHKGTYGFCDRCKEPIVLARLKYVPQTKYCINCEKILRK